MSESKNKDRKVEQGRRNFLKFSAGVAAAVGIATVFRPLASHLLKPEKKETEVFKKALSQIEKALSDMSPKNWTLG